MGLSLRERRRQLLRDEIIHAACILIAQKGHASMSMDEVATKVGISKPTLYSYFATKDELVVTAAISAMNQVIEIIESEQADKTPLQRLKLMLHTILRIHIEEGTVASRPYTPELFNFLCDYPQAQEAMLQTDELVVSLVEAAIAQGEIHACLDTTSVVRAFYALIHSLNFGHMSRAAKIDPDTIAENIATIFERGVQKGTCSSEALCL